MYLLKIIKSPKIEEAYLSLATVYKVTTDQKQLKLINLNVIYNSHNPKKMKLKISIKRNKNTCII